MNTFRLLISTPDGNVFDGAVVQLCLRGSEGDLAVMAGHIPFMTAYAPENAGSKQKTERRGPDM